MIRRLEIIGEAVKNIPNEFRSTYPDIPWKQMAGMRDIVIHQYFGVSPGLIWKTAVSDIPELEEKIRKILFELN